MIDRNLIYNQPIVLDNGSNTLKSGFSGGKKPLSFEYNRVGNIKYDKLMNAAPFAPSDTIVGNQAQKYRGILKLRRPMSQSEIVHWDDMELIWSHIFNNVLQIDSNSLDQHPLLITEAPLNCRKNREKMIEVFFETFNLDAIYVAMPEVLSLYAHGSTTGCILSCNDSYCCSVPIYQGFSLPSTIKRTNFGGYQLTSELQMYLRKFQGVSLFNSNEQEIVRTIKEKTGFVSLDYKDDEEQNLHKFTSKFKLPDGHIIDVERDKYRIPEILFRPLLINNESDSVSDMLYHSIKQVDKDLQTQLMCNIVLNGGSTLFSGFGQRLLNELNDKFSGSGKIKIVAPKDRLYSSWIGGSILSNLSTFRNLWLEKQVYNDDPTLIHKKFI